MSSVDEVRKATSDLINETGKTVDSGLQVAAKGLGQTLAVTQQTLTDAYAAVLQVLDHAQEYVDAGAATARKLEDATVAGVKGAIQYTASNPLTAYPALGTAALLALPGTRRYLYKITFGRFTSPETIIRRSQGKVDMLKSQITDYTAQVQKLEERLMSGEDELKRGYAKLKSARLELQRLGRSVHSSQTTAESVVRDLRLVKKVDGSLALRGEAASQAATLKAQLARITKDVNRIAKQDI